MTALEGVPERVYQAIVFGVALYFAFLGIGVLTGSPAFLLAADVYFGLLAVGLGVLLFARAATVTPLLVTAATALLLGGVAQFFWIATRDGQFDLLSSALVFVGIAGYLLAVLRAD